MELAGTNRTFSLSEETTANPQIVWLASYPKSGNTWFRSFISVLQKNKEFNINKLETDGIFSGKTILEDTLDVDTDYLSLSEMEEFRKVAFSYISENGKKIYYYKIHDAFTFSEKDGLPLVPIKPSKLAIYIIRNPLDVALSLANHINSTVDKAIEGYLTSEAGSFGKKSNAGGAQLFQPLLSWSTHVESWLKYPTFPVHFIRYEDMKNLSFETFKGAVNAIGLDVTDQQIQEAIEATAFEKLKKQEDEGGFKEKMVQNTTFFFKGEAGRWKKELTEQQIKKIREANEPMMRHFGYW